MKKNIYGKGLNKKIWHSIYANRFIIDIYNNLTKENLQTLDKLGFSIENRLYTEKEFDLIDFALLDFYKVNENDEILQTEILTIKNVKKEEFQRVLDMFNNIAQKYNL